MGESAQARPRKGNGAPRDTATFTAYFWEAYNEIARPDRFDWYLVTRWLKDLGPDGFTVLKALRNLCYFNPRDGALRDTCQVTVDELAEVCGMTRSTVYRVLETNVALKQFVRKETEAIHIEGRTRRLPPRWRVCMDTPIHPDDMEEYDRMRGDREIGRADDEEEKRKSQIEIYEKRKSQNGISGGRKSQTEERKSQNGERKSQSGITNKEVSIPSVSIPSDSVPAKPEKEIPPIDPPEGEEGVWAAVLDVLADQVQAGEINAPTWHGHLTRLRLASLTAQSDGVCAVVIAPSAFTRDWVEKRQGDRLRHALASVLGRETETVTMEFRGETK